MALAINVIDRHGPSTNVSSVTAKEDCTCHLYKSRCFTHPLFLKRWSTLVLKRVCRTGGKVYKSKLVNTVTSAIHVFACSNLYLYTPLLHQPNISVQ